MTKARRRIQTSVHQDLKSIPFSLHSGPERHCKRFDLSQQAAKQASKVHELGNLKYLTWLLIPHVLIIINQRNIPEYRRQF